jgi:hypothetical protein
MEVAALASSKLRVPLIDGIPPFDANKCGLGVMLRDLKLVEQFAGNDGRFRFVTTEAFLHRFKLAHL